MFFILPVMLANNDTIYLIDQLMGNNMNENKGPFIQRIETPEVKIPNMMRKMLDLHHEPYFIKDLDSRFVYANLAMAKLVSVKSPDTIIGRLDNEVQSKVFDNESSVIQWQTQDQKVRCSLKPLTHLEIHRGSIEHPFINRKIPLYNDSNECIGVACYMKNLEVFSLNDLLKNRAPGSLLLSKPDNYFTEKECEIIFLKLQGMTSKDVGKVLNLSGKTIDNRLNILYSKAGVSHFDEFFEFCRNRGYDCYLPTKFISSKIINFDKEPEDIPRW